MFVTGGWSTEEAGSFVWFWFSQDSGALSRQAASTAALWVGQGGPQRRPRDLEAQAPLPRAVSEGGGSTG